jgi:hypothetical protein
MGKTSLLKVTAGGFSPDVGRTETVVTAVAANRKLAIAAAL